jgi:hypothetical protein
LEAAPDAFSTELLPSEQAISREEESIMWRSLERVPDLYREPLVLFYREHQSVERVAEALEISPEAVKQRLARGRKMLHEEVAAFVEGALERTTPGKAFTLGVLAALPVFGAGSTAAATLGGTAVKVGTAAKGASVAGLAGALLGPVIPRTAVYGPAELVLPLLRSAFPCGVVSPSSFSPAFVGIFSGGARRRDCRIGRRLPCRLADFYHQIEPPPTADSDGRWN